MSVLCLALRISERPLFARSRRLALPLSFSPTTIVQRAASLCEVLSLFFAIALRLQNAGIFWDNVGLLSWTAQLGGG